jgi:1-acyl-sn-glycerol-3-phosphate acyltransferase
VFPPVYRVFRGVAGMLLHGLFDLRVEGAERLPVAGPFILASNHHNYLDGVVLGVAVPRPIAFLVMPRVFRATPLHPPFHRRIGSIPVALERPDPGAIKRVLQVLDPGRVVGIFPEGPFSQEGRLVGGRPGAAMVALRAGVPVVPAAIEGTYGAAAGRTTPAQPPLAVRSGGPIHFSPPPRAHRADQAGDIPIASAGDRHAPACPRALPPAARTLVTAAALWRAWSGRFAGGPIRTAEAFTPPCPDRRLCFHDRPAAPRRRWRRATDPEASWRLSRARGSAASSRAAPSPSARA